MPPDGDEAADPDALKDGDALPCIAPSVTKGVEGRLRQNIVSDYFFEKCRGLKTVDQLLAEVDEWDAWEANAWGGASRLGIGMRGASLISRGQGDGSTQAPTRLWCTFVRLLDLRLTAGQLRGLLSSSRAEHRVLGALFCRYTLPPAVLMKWLRSAATDADTIVPIVADSAKAAGEKVSMAEFTRSLLLEERFLGTLMPRIPARHVRAIQDALEKAQREKAPAADAAPADGKRAREEDNLSPEELKRRRRYARLDELVAFYADKDKQSLQPQETESRSPSASPVRPGDTPDVDGEGSYGAQRRAQRSAATNPQARTAVRKLANLVAGAR